MALVLQLFAALVLTDVAAAVVQTPWAAYNLSPTSRTLVPVGVYQRHHGSAPPSPPSPSPPPPSGVCEGPISEWNAAGPGFEPAPQLTLACPKGESIVNVSFAAFGAVRKQQGQKCSFSTGGCNDATAPEVVAKQCLGKSSCTIPPTAGINGQTKPGTPSQLQKLFGVDPCLQHEKEFAASVVCGTHATAGAAGAVTVGDGATGDGAHATDGTVTGAAAGAVATKPTVGTGLFPIALSGAGDSVTLDFGKEVGGYTSVTFGTVSSGAAATFAWSESTFYVLTSDHSNGGSGDDGVILSGPLVNGRTWTATGGQLRGGFRYLTVAVGPGGGSFAITGVTLEFTAAPAWGPDPSVYHNHFHSSDALVNRVWYGCAYTVQLCTISSAHGRQWPPPALGWNNDATCGTGSSVLVDGAKRDRVIWPGDMGVSTATAFATTGDTYSSQMSLETLYVHQTSSGMLPYAGPPVSFYGNSDTYHLWSLIGTVNFVVATGNSSWLQRYWHQYQLGVEASYRKLHDGLMVVDKAADWARCCQGGKNIAANALLYKVLCDAASMAALIGNSSAAVDYGSKAAALKDAINTLLWDPAKGAYVNVFAPARGEAGEATPMYPQDGNSLAVWFNVTNATTSGAVSAYLASNWGQYGAQTPEWNNDIGTFPGSMEVYAHMAAGNSTRALEMIRLQWGYMLSYPNSTNSTFWEGYHKDGTFAYQGIYMSNAHGWATGAAGALSRYVLGLQPMSAGGLEYWVAPQTGDLEWCEGSLRFAPGHKVAVSWTVSRPPASNGPPAGGTQFALSVDTTRASPASSGMVGVELHREVVAAAARQGTGLEIEHRGEVVWRRDATALAAMASVANPESDDGRAWFAATPGSVLEYVLRPAAQEKH